MGLGTDGVAGSNNDQDMMEEMDLAAKLQKVSTRDPRALPAEQAFAMATIIGARALHMERQIGSLEAGKRADMILLESKFSARGAPLQRVLATGIRAKGFRCHGRDGERAADRARPQHADSRPKLHSRKSGGISRTR